MDKSATIWSTNPVLTWGLGGYVAANVGYFVTALVLEALLSIPYLAKMQISYVRGKPRSQEVEAIRAAVAPLAVQFKTAAWHMAGPNGLLNGLASALILPLVIPNPTTAWPSWWEFVVGMIAMVILNDFALYWGHRAQHESEFLWKNFHHLHHSVTTPSPISTVYIHPIDATLQGGIPILVAAILVQPHPVTFYVFVVQRVAENCFNHSGLNSTVADALFLKSLPLRASVAHHDAHHHFSNYSRNAKNYGEAFWLWDWLFGTLTNTQRLAKSHKM